MVHVQVSEHKFVNIRRRSLCDNCCVYNCTSFNGSRVTECKEFRPMLSVFMKCRECGRIYDPYSNLCSLNYELCPECNHSGKCADIITFICRE